MSPLRAKWPAECRLSYFGRGFPRLTTRKRGLNMASMLQIIEKWFGTGGLCSISVAR